MTTSLPTVVVHPNCGESVLGNGAYVPPYSLISVMLTGGLLDFEVIFDRAAPRNETLQGGSGTTSGMATSASVAGLEVEGTFTCRSDFRDYADLCFKEFGDKIKLWTTINEPWTYASIGYDSGQFAPGRCSAWMNNSCVAGDSATEPYIVGHHMLLAHAEAAKVYRTKYRALQKGEIGIVLVSRWFEQYSKTKEDAKAAKRAIDFMFGWFIDPLTSGDYPENMRRLVQDRLPKFTTEQAEMVKGSYDFLGLNYYTSNYASNVSPYKVNISYSRDSQVNETTERNGKLIGEPTGSSVFFAVPEGLHKFLVYTKKKYKNPTIYVTENGMSDANVTGVQQGVNDFQRVDFYRRHLLALNAALK
nr:furcatin hydrolase-like [Nicotiana tomentosiformis]